MTMDQLIAGFSNQLKEAIAIGKSAQLTPHNFPISNIVVTGLGGSGIGGDLVNEFIADELRIPFAVNKDYFLPSYVNKNTLVIVSSYSGNTEETLNALQIALNRKSKIVCVSSGGKIIQIAKEKGLDHIIVPGGNPPRASLGYSFVQQLFALHYLGIIPNQFEQELNNAIALLDANETAIREEAKKVALQLDNTIPIIYTTTPMASVAVRFRQQINENGKMLCWHHVVPEMNHNELVGWRKKSSDWAVVFLRNQNDYSRNIQRIAINKEIISQYCDTIIDINSKGSSHIERALYLIHLTDWVSFFLAEQQKLDATEVKVIDFLKNSLANV